MKTFYSNILVEVDFAKDPGASIRTALAMVHPGHSIIHLVHIVKQNSLWFWKNWRKTTPVDGFSSEREAHHFVEVILKLLRWKNWIDTNYTGIFTIIHIRKGKDPQKLIARLADHLGSELIILSKYSGKHNFLIPRSSISPEKLAKQTKSVILRLDQNICFSYFRNDLFSTRLSSNDSLRNLKAMEFPELFEEADWIFSPN